MNIKLIYQDYVQDDHFLSYCTIVGSIVGILGALVWGYLGDLKGFAKTMLFLAILDFIIKIYSDFAVSKVTIMIMLILIGVTSRATTTIVGPGFV